MVTESDTQETARRKMVYKNQISSTDFRNIGRLHFWQNTLSVTDGCQPDRILNWNFHITHTILTLLS